MLRSAVVISMQGGRLQALQMELVGSAPRVRRNCTSMIRCTIPCTDVPGVPKLSVEVPPYLLSFGCT